jgi:cytochrome b
VTGSSDVGRKRSDPSRRRDVAGDGQGLGPFGAHVHWSLVGLFVVAYGTGDEVEQIHIAAGYAIAAPLALRIIWGFVGPRHARFRSFVRSPREVVVYLWNVLRFKAPRHLGHNPAGGTMIIALIAMLAATCTTGYTMTTDAYWGAKWVEATHELLANATVALIALHVIGVLVASFQHRENLVKAMVTGRKTHDGGYQSLD